jgi:hypothetical protein
MILQSIKKPRGLPSTRLYHWQITALLRQYESLSIKGRLSDITRILTQQLDSRYEIAMTLWSFAKVSQTEGNQQRAVHLYLAAKNAYDSIGAWTKEHNLKFEEYFTLCRAALSESVFAEAVEQGRAMTMEQAIAYALEETP